MEAAEKEKLIKNLAESRENVVLLQNMLKKEQSNVEHELRIIGEARRYLDEVLYGLTGNDFYRSSC